MSSLSASIAPTFFFVFVLLLSQVFAARIPIKSEIASRDSPPQVPDANEPAFASSVLEKVNTYRSYQDAPALDYDADLANYAASLAHQCDIESRLDGQYGDILTGGSPSTFGRDSWDGLTLADAAAHLIQGWYNANISYIADPTFEFLPFGRSYTQLVWKATKHIGCAWTPPSCKFEDASAFYLRCVFFPKGNILGQFEQNVCCKGCPIPPLPTPSAKSEALQERQTTGSPYSDLIYVRFSAMRAAAGVPLIKWDGASAAVAKILAQKCNGNDQNGEILSIPIPDSPGFIPTWDATNKVIDAWDNEIHTTDATVSPNYAQITADNVNVFVCGWNDNVCPFGKWYMHCFFGSWSAGTGSPSQLNNRQVQNLDLDVPNSERFISERQLGDVNVNMNDYSLILTSGINDIRKDSGQAPVSWSDSLVDRTHIRGALCSSFAALSTGQLILNKEWPTSLGDPNFTILSLVVGGLWNATKPANGYWNHASYMPEYVKITQPRWTEVGCSWSRNCTAANNYIIYCEFSDAKLTPRAAEHTLSARQDEDLWIQDNVGFLLATMRDNARLKNPTMTLSGPQVTQAQDDADKCNGVKDNTLYDQIVFKYDEAAGPLSKEVMTYIALENWSLQGQSPDAAEKTDWKVITNPNNRQFGCAWSTKCGGIHYLYCSFYHG